MSTERLRKAMEQERRERLRDVERLEEEAKKPRPSDQTRMFEQKLRKDEKLAAAWQTDLTA